MSEGPIYSAIAYDIMYLPKAFGMVNYDGNTAATTLHQTVAGIGDCNELGNECCHYLFVAITYYWRNATETISTCDAQIIPVKHNEFKPV